MSGGPVVGVLSGCGGAGASVLAAAIAGCSGESTVNSGRHSSGATASKLAHQPRPAFLIDCDRMGGGIDVLLGAERAAGPRWRQVRLRGGELAPRTLVDTLPRWGDVRFLAADDSAELDPGSVRKVLAAAALAGPVVADLPRWPSPVRSAAIAVCDRVILVTPAEVRAVTASALVAAGLDPDRSMLAVRGAARSLSAERIGELLGLSLLGHIPWDPACARPTGLDVGRLKRATRTLARAALDLSPEPARGQARGGEAA